MVFTKKILTSPVFSKDLQMYLYIYLQINFPVQNNYYVSPEKISHEISLWNFYSEHEIKQEKNRDQFLLGRSSNFQPNGNIF